MWTRNISIEIDLLPRVMSYCRVVALTRVGWSNAATSSATQKIPSMAEAAIIVSSNITGANVNALIDFVSISGIQQNDLISLRFPPGFNVSQAIAVSGSFETRHVAHCGTDCLVSPEMVTVVYVASTSLPASTQISLTVNGIVNRNSAGASLPFELRLLNAAGTFTTEEDLEIPGISLQAGFLGQSSVRLGDERTSSNNTVGIAFVLSNRNPWPSRMEKFSSKFLPSLISVC